MDISRVDWELFAFFFEGFFIIQDGISCSGIGENVDNERCDEGGDNEVFYFKTHLTKIKTNIKKEKRR